eukprot:42545-Eustigmatos_ZCMA.PRE.1
MLIHTSIDTQGNTNTSTSEAHTRNHAFSRAYIHLYRAYTHCRTVGPLEPVGPVGAVRPVGPVGPCVNTPPYDNDNRVMEMTLT